MNSTQILKIITDFEILILELSTDVHIGYLLLKVGNAFQAWNL